MNALDVDGAPAAVPESAKGPWDRHFGSFAPRVRGVACLALPAMAGVGVLRLAGLLQGPRATPALGLAPDQQAELDDLSDNPTAARGGEACDREEGMEQVRASGDLGDRPLILLFSPNRAFPAALNQAQIDQVQPRLAKLSSRGRLLVVEEITPAAIVSAVHDVMGALAAENPAR